MKSTRKSVDPVVTQLQDAADRERCRLLLVLGPEVELGADVEVADVVSRPNLTHARVTVDDAPRLLIGCENRPNVAVDPGVEQERAKNLGPPAEPDAESASDVTYVGETLLEVRAAAVPADGPLAVSKHLGRGHEPEPRIPEERRRRRSRLGR
jgi:hypothetical protein